MNIFVTDHCPIQSARNLPDKHIVKMPLETCQMLAIIYSDWYYGVGKLYKVMAHPMLPSVVHFATIHVRSGLLPTNTIYHGSSCMVLHYATSTLHATTRCTHAMQDNASRFASTMLASTSHHDIYKDICIYIHTCHARVHQVRRYHHYYHKPTSISSTPSRGYTLCYQLSTHTIT